MTEHGISTPTLEAFGGPNTQDATTAVDKEPEPSEHRSTSELRPVPTQKQAAEKGREPQAPIGTSSKIRSLHIGPRRFQLIERLPGVNSTPDGFPKYGYRVDIFHDDGSKEPARLLLDYKIEPYQPAATYETRVIMVSLRSSTDSKTIYARRARITEINPKKYSGTKRLETQLRTPMIDQIIRDLPIARLNNDNQRSRELMTEGERLLPHLSGKQAKAIREILYGKSDAS